MNAGDDARDATIAELRTDVKDACTQIAELRAEVEGARAALYDEGVAHGEALSRAEKAEAEVERLNLHRIAIAEMLKAEAEVECVWLRAEVERLRAHLRSLAPLHTQVEQLQADLTEARAVVELLLPWCPVDFHGSDVCRRAAAVLAKSEGGK